MTEPPGEDLEELSGGTTAQSSRSWNTASLWRGQPGETQLKAASARQAPPAPGVRGRRPQFFFAAVGAEERHLPFFWPPWPFFCPPALLAHVSRLSSARLTHAANCSPSARSFS